MKINYDRHISHKSPLHWYRVLFIAYVERGWPRQYLVHSSFPIFHRSSLSLFVFFLEVGHTFAGLEVGHTSQLNEA